jgi:hypothetical protein
MDSKSSLLLGLQVESRKDYEKVQERPIAKLLNGDSVQSFKKQKQLIKFDYFSEIKFREIHKLNSRNEIHFKGKLSASAQEEGDRV